MREYITKEYAEQASYKTPVQFGPIGEDVYKRTYSRTKLDGTNETWVDTIRRVVNGNLNFVPERFVEKDEAEKLFDLLLNMEFLPAGRHLWATGIGNNKAFIFNCFTSSYTERFSEHFDFTFMRLMEGGGVGANYSNLFIHSREGNKPWQVKRKINVHLICHPTHQDFDGDVQLEDLEEKFYNTHYFFEETDPNKEQRKLVQTFTSAGFKLSPHTGFKNLLSTKYDCDWDPGISNGHGPVYLRVEDSREGWAKALTTLLDLSVQEGNEIDYVVDVSNIRARGAILKGFGGRASGPDALMLLLQRVNRLLNEYEDKVLDTRAFMLIDHFIASSVVAGGVRRSSRMSCKYWKDPDIFEFIDCKLYKPDQISANWTTNISVVIDNKFFRALKRGDEHAEKVYDLVCERMLTNGEPGFINASKCLEGEAPDTLFFATNPCVPGDTPILTKEGYKPIGETIGQDTWIWNGNEWSLVKPFSTGLNDLVKVQLSDGTSLRCTPYHKWILADGTRVLAKDLIAGSKLAKFSMPVLEGGETYSVDAYSQGFYAGDGNEGYNSSWVYEPKEMCIPHLIGSTTAEPQYHRHRWNHSKMLDKAFVPINGTKEYCLNWLAGLLDADGNITDNPNSINLAINSTNKSFLLQTRLMLTRLGVQAKLNLMHEERSKLMPDGKGGQKEYDCQACYRLLINSNDVIRLVQNGLVTRRVDLSKAQATISKARFVTVESVVPDGYEETFCFTDQLNNSGTFNGIVTANCGEIAMVEYQDLQCFDICCLAHINLARAKNPKEAFRLATRFLIRATFAQVADFKQAQNVSRNRRIGVGITGYHNWLAKNRIKYSDAASNSFVRDFFKEAYRIVDTEAKKFCHQLRIPECIKKTTIAPVGTVSQLAGSTTGMQSVFSKFYIRRVRYANTDPNLERLKQQGFNILPDLYAANTSVVEYLSIDPIFVETINELKSHYLVGELNDTELDQAAEEEAIQLIEDQYELKLEDVLANQRMLQKEFVDNAISITINVDSTKYTKEDLKNTLKHYLPDLKGVTIFPETSMALTPYERVTKEYIDQKREEGYPIQISQAEIECVNGACPIR